MSRLDRYIFKAAALPFVLILTCTTAIAWLTQVLQRMDIIVDDGGTLSVFVKITLLLIPSLVGIVAPIALLAACIYVLNALMVDSEIPVMRAAGASRFRIARPLFLLAIMAMGLIYFINLDLGPRSHRQLRDTIWDVRSNIASSLIRDRVFANLTPGVTFYAEDVRPGDQYVGVHIHDSRNPMREVTYTAENGLFTMTDNGPALLLLRGTGQQLNRNNGKIEIVRFNETAIDLAEFDSSAPITKPYEPEERFLSELFNPDLSRPYDQQYQERFLAEAHARLSTPLYALAFTLLASLFMLGATTNRRGYGRRILLAAVTAAGLRILGFLTQSLSGEAPVFNGLQYALPLGTIVYATFALLHPSRFRKPPLNDTEPSPEAEAPA